MILTCKACHLRDGCRQPVPGRGSENARIAVLAEAPGQTEDYYGIPLAGPSGYMVKKMLDSVGIPEDEVYFTNAVKCRPAGNRTPNKNEVKFCVNLHLENELTGIPKLKHILLLGNTAYRAVTGKDCKITKDIGNVIDVFGKYKGLLLYHPSYLIRRNGMDPDSPKYQQWVILADYLKQVDLL